MTVQKCIDGCDAAGFSSAGVEYGRECWCGDVTFPPDMSADISECNMPCLGDASQYVPNSYIFDYSLKYLDYRICGGRSRILVYTLSDTDTNPTPPPDSWGAPIEGGCWSDNVDQIRALDRSLGGFNDLTPSKCQALCQDQGFKIAGVESGSECCEYLGFIRFLAC
jgi:hypothetical protein